jgi:uncharacterized protein (DUF302 family)
MVQDFQYTVPTTLSFADAVEAVKAKTVEKGFRVLYVHEIDKTLAEKGFDSEPYSIIEVCNAKYAHRALSADKMVGLLMPCKVNVFVKEGEVFLSTLRPQVLASFFPEAGLEELAAEIDVVLMDIVEGSK